MLPMVRVESAATRAPENKGVVMVFWIVPQKQLRGEIIPIGIIKILKAKRPKRFKRIGYEINGQQYRDGDSNKSQQP